MFGQCPLIHFRSFLSAVFLSGSHCSPPWVTLDTNLGKKVSRLSPEGAIHPKASNYYLENVSDIMQKLK